MIKRSKKTLGIIGVLISVSLFTACQSNEKTNDVSNGDMAKIESIDLKSLVKYEDNDYYTEWKDDKVNSIKLNGGIIDFNGEGASVEGSKITIKKAGTYEVSGTLDDGAIIVEAGKEDVVRILFNGANINSSNSSPLYVKSADKVVLSLEEGSENYISDGKIYTSQDVDNKEPNSAIFSKEDVTINGKGTLTVKGNYNNGITSKDKLKIMEGTVKIYSADDGIMGRDMVAIKTGVISIEAEGDGIKSTNDTEENKGFVLIEDGDINIKATNDGIQGATHVGVDNGDITLITGGGSHNGTKAKKSDNMQPTEQLRPKDDKVNSQDKGNPPATMEEPRAPLGSEESPQIQGQQSNPPTELKRPEGETDPQGNIAVPTKPSTSQGNSTEAETESAKAIKAVKNIQIAGGTFNIDSSDDAIHSNDSVNISGGKIDIASGDDGVHGDGTVEIAGGEINITKSYEGIEGANINIKEGKIYVTASDDGINVAGGNDSSSINGRPGQNNFNSSSNNKLNIVGGYVVVDSKGDGLDANGSIYMEGGTIIVNGPTDNGNGALDYDGTFDITGGVLVAAGSAGMAQGLSNESKQNSILMTYTATQKKGTLVRLEDEGGNEILTFCPEKEYQSIVISAPELKNGNKYILYSGGNASSTEKNGLYSKGDYSGATSNVPFELSQCATYLNESGITTEKAGFNKGGKGERPSRP